MFDPLIANPGRLRILTALAAEHDAATEFVRLRDGTGLTDGNLATHARRLSSAGLLAIEKRFRDGDGKPVTTLSLTPRGRQALHDHVRQLMDVLQPAPPAQIPRHSPVPLVVAAADEPAATADDDEGDDDWVD